MAEQMSYQKRPDWLPERLFPFESHFVEIDGHSVHYVDEGDGPPLLMLHGNPTWSFLYRRMIPALSERFRCIALDYPGFGLSTAHDEYTFCPREHARVVAQFVELLDLDEIVLLGHDWGGPIGLWVAHQQTNRFSAFVLANTFAWPLNGNWRIEALSKLAAGRVGEGLIRRYNAFVNLAMPLGTRERLPRQVMKCYRRPFALKQARVATYVFARELIRSRHFLAEVERGLKDLGGSPTLLVWGERDPAFGASERMHFEEVLPGHELALLPTARHFIQEDDPETVVEAIDEWANLALARF